MTTELSTMLALIAILAIVIAGIGGWWINRTPKIRRDESERLPLFTGLGPPTFTGAEGPSAAAPRMTPPRVTPPRVTPPTAGPAAAPPARPVAPSAARQTARPEASRLAPPLATPVAPRPAIREFTTTSAPAVTPPISAPPPNLLNAPLVSDAGVPGTMIEGHAIRFSVPAEGTLQFLPGRLEIGSGLDAGREIRFVHVPGPNGTEVTFGRTDGALYRHIQLRDKTVSRQHALLQWRDGHWYLRNLSLTNPVARNGVVLDTAYAECLQDGDRLEMGEVVFTFRSR